MLAKTVWLYSFPSTYFVQSKAAYSEVVLVYLNMYKKRKQINEAIYLFDMYANMTHDSRTEFCTIFIQSDHESNYLFFNFINSSFISYYNVQWR